MKLVHTADIHIGMENYGKLDPQTGLSTRILDFLKAFDKAVNFAIEQKIDIFLFAGDAFKTRDPNPTQQREFAKRILKLAKNNIPVVLLVGNHDTPNTEAKANTLDIYSTLEIDNVHVLRKVELIKVNGLQIIGIPWLQRSEYENLAEKLNMLYKKLDPKLPCITMVHATVEGATFGSERSLTVGKDLSIPLPLLQHDNVSYVALGHIHKRQVLSKNPPVVYSGSIERVDFGEEKDDKSFEYVEIEGKIVTHKPISTNPRPFKTIKVDIKENSTNPTEEILEEIKKTDIKDAIVKVVIDIPSDLADLIQINEIKKYLQDAHSIAGISKNVQRVVRTKLEGFTDKEILPLDALKVYFNAKNYNQNKIKTLTDFAKELMETE